MTPYSAALYIHIPFCSSKCDYCDFFSITDYSRVKDTIDGIVAQVKEDKNLYRIRNFSSIYIGGGTPGSLSPELIASLMDSLFRINGNRLPREVTMECNPVNVTSRSLAVWQSGGINRISLGVQTFRDPFLRKAGRKSSEKKIHKAIPLIKSQPGLNLSLDLIQGLPGMSGRDQLADLEEAVRYNPDHISWYTLSLEGGTVLTEQWEDRQDLNISAETEEQIWQEGCRLLEQNGYERYEVSNFAKPGRQCLHNKAYWRMKPYLGVGPGAVSMVREDQGKIRRHRVIRDVEAFASGKRDKDDVEILCPIDFMKDYFLMGLRMKEGINLKSFKNIFGFYPENFVSLTIEENLLKGNLARDDDFLFLTEKGLDLLNPILVEFFTELEEQTGPIRIDWPEGGAGHP